MRKVAVVLAFALALFLAGPALAHEGHEHKVMGTVAAIDDKHVDITGKDGHNTTIWLNGETKFLRGKSSTTVGEVKVGERVVITAVEKDEKMIAREVLVAASGK